MQQHSLQFCDAHVPYTWLQLYLSSMRDIYSSRKDSIYSYLITLHTTPYALILLFHYAKLSPCVQETRGTCYDTP